MKKTFATIMFTAAIISTACSSCGRVSMAKVDVVDPVSYKEFTAKEQIVEGPQTAQQTITKLLGKEVTIGKDCPPNSALENKTLAVSSENQEQYTCYKVEDYDDNKDMIIFLFEDDTRAVAATETKENFVHGDDYIDMAWKNAENQNEMNHFNDVAYAYHSDNSSNSILSTNEGTCTSVWAYNDETSEIKLIWCDYISCPIWKSYVD